MCGDYNLRREKRYVEVDVRFTPDGKIRPLAINYDKAHTYGIDRVLAVKHGTSRFGVKGSFPTRSVYSFMFIAPAYCRGWCHGL